ncbi:ATP-binding cassette domain-containing protein [Bariatricus sp. HCP28S3_D3]|uniref:ATP-binding cassette domain-containing protein n=1 Tax=Bariatricus sp. HCP28S3_D3 TaxID=3438901 RepID=UPI003F8948A5
MNKYLKLMTNKTKVKCAGIIALAMVSSVLASIWPVKLGELYTDISGGKISGGSQGIVAIATFGLIYFSAECITILRRVLLDCIIATHEAEIRETSVEKLLKMPVSYYAGCLSGEKTAQLNQGVAGLSQLIKILCNDIVATVLTAACTLIQVVLKAPLAMAGIMLLYLATTLLVSVFQIRSQNGIRENIIKQKNSLDGQICQSISNLELIRSMDAEEYERIRLEPAIQKVSATEKKHHRYMGSFDCVKQFCKIAFQVIILFASIIMVANGRMSAGAVISVCMLFQQLIKPIDEVYRFMDETASSVVKAKVLTEVMDSGEDSIFSVQAETHSSSEDDIVLRDVAIKNPEKNKTLAYYDRLRIPGNKVVALSGESGCGKTTMIRSLTRYYPYTSGAISVFGNDLDMYSQHELTDKLCYLPQKAFFFAGTIRENLVYGIERTVTDEEMRSALRKACLLDALIEKVSKHSTTTVDDILSYEIGEGGTGLSGGECQRLSLARAFLRKPKLYIFDESTANLDAVTADKVLTNIEEYAKAIKAGVVYISHDKNVVDRCDTVIYVDNKVGTYEEQLAA